MMNLCAISFMSFVSGVLVPAGFVLTLRAWLPSSEDLRDPGRAAMLHGVATSAAARVYFGCAAALAVGLVLICLTLTVLYGLVDAQIHRARNLGNTMDARAPDDYVARGFIGAVAMFLRMVVEFVTLMLLTSLVFVMIPLFRGYLILTALDHRGMSYIVAPKAPLSPLSPPRGAWQTEK